MPIIEIISLRLNLDKDEDRRLFETINEQADAGKRNEFLKRILLQCLVGAGSGGKSSAKQTKPRIRAGADQQADQIAPAPPAQPLPVSAPAPGPPVEPAGDRTTVKQTETAPHEQAADNSEAAGLVASFMK
jgi:hypothetical protein